MMLSLDQPAK